jgi:TatD DNase family protein
VIDAHIHLDQYPKKSLPECIERWRNAGIRGVVAVSSNLSSSYRTLELRELYPDFIFAAVGYHPEQPLPAEKEIVELESLMKWERKNISAIGEVGLPHYSLVEGNFNPTSLSFSTPNPFSYSTNVRESSSTLERYTELLQHFCYLANQQDLPLLLHAVHDKATIALDHLVARQVGRAHFHWLKAKNEVVERIIQEGYHISVTPEVCYRERDQHLLQQIPIEYLLLETDGPWRYTGPFEGQQTSPLFLKEISEKVAKIKNTSATLIERKCDKNIMNLLE